MKDIAGKVVLITGSAMGTGYSLAILFARDKAKVILVDINEGALRKAISELTNMGGEVYPYICDVADRSQVHELATRVHEKVGPVSILVNNAGVAYRGKLTEVSDEKHASTMNINIMGYVWMTREFLPDMLAKRRGNLVYLAATGGLAGVPMLTSYCASKHAVVGFAEALRQELMLDNSLRNIHITTVCPSSAPTATVEGAASPQALRRVESEKIARQIYQAIKGDRAMLIVPGISLVKVAFKLLSPANTRRLLWLFSADISRR